MTIHPYELNSHPGWKQFLAILAFAALTGCATGSGHTPSDKVLQGEGHDRVPEQVTPDLYPKGASPEPEPVVRYGRYTLVSTSPRAEQRDLLSQIVDVTVPRTMDPSVRDAMDYVLQRSGYSLCQGGEAIEVLYGLPLPAAHYQLGPMTLRNTIQILAGPAWQVIVNDVTRTICFEQREGYQQVVKAEHPVVSGDAK